MNTSRYPQKTPEKLEFLTSIVNLNFCFFLSFFPLEIKRATYRATYQATLRTVNCCTGTRHVGVDISIFWAVFCLYSSLSEHLWYLLHDLWSDWPLQGHIKPPWLRPLQLCWASSLYSERFTKESLSRFACTGFIGPAQPLLHLTQFESSTMPCQIVPKHSHSLPTRAYSRNKRCYDKKSKPRGGRVSRSVRPRIHIYDWRRILSHFGKTSVNWRIESCVGRIYWRRGSSLCQKDNNHAGHWDSKMKMISNRSHTIIEMLSFDSVVSVPLQPQQSFEPCT